MRNLGGGGGSPAGVPTASASTDAPTDAPTANNGTNNGLSAATTASIARPDAFSSASASGGAHHLFHHLSHHSTRHQSAKTAAKTTTTALTPSSNTQLRNAITIPAPLAPASCQQKQQATHLDGLHLPEQEQLLHDSDSNGYSNGITTNANLQKRHHNPHGDAGCIPHTSRLTSGAVCDIDDGDGDAELDALGISHNHSPVFTHSCSPSLESSSSPGFPNNCASNPECCGQSPSLQTSVLRESRRNNHVKHRIVNQSSSGSSSPFLGLDGSAHSSVPSSPPEPPPRNPLRQHLHLQRLVQLQLYRDLNWRPSSSLYEDDDDDDGTIAISGGPYDVDARSNDGGSWISLSPTSSPSTTDMYRSSPMPAHMAMPADHISPPSSPDGSFGAGTVSPIEEEPDMSEQDLLRGNHHTPPPESQLQKSQIPTMRRERRKQQNEAATAKRENRLHDRRRQSQRFSAGPQMFQDFIPPSERSDSPSLGLTTVVEGPESSRNGTASPSFGQRVRQLGKPKTELVDNRPPWKGASGRAVQLNPVHDNPNVGPLNMPGKGNKRIFARRGASISSPPASPPSSETSKTTAAMRKLFPTRAEQGSSRAATPSISSPQPMVQPDVAALSYPSPPRAESPAFSYEVRSTPNRMSLVMPSQALSSHPVSSAAIKRKPPPRQTGTGPSHISTRSTSALRQQLNPDVSAFTAAHEDTWTQPPSRFSITTYSTSAPSTPRETEDSQYEQDHTPSRETPSVMDRRRPLAREGSPRTGSPNPIVISINSTSAAIPTTSEDIKPKLKPIPDRQAHVRALSSMDSMGRLASLTSTSKPLPLAPPEMTSNNDRVAVLNAQLTGLYYRRANINKSIKQMTELMPRDNLLAEPAVMRKREDERQKVEALREELSEIQREEHDLGLKLHRAYKRLDKEASFEPTGLWVRRVTG